MSGAKITAPCEAVSTGNASRSATGSPSIAQSECNSVTVSSASGCPISVSTSARTSADGAPVVIRSTSDEQKRTRSPSQARKGSASLIRCAMKSTIAARRGPLSGTSSVGITKTMGPVGSAWNRACNRSVSRDGKVSVARSSASRNPASVTLLTMTRNSGRMATSRMASLGAIHQLGHAVWRALDYHDRAVDVAGAIGGVDGIGTDGAQQHAGAELEDAFRAIGHYFSRNFISRSNFAPYGGRSIEMELMRDCAKTPLA